MTPNNAQPPAPQSLFDESNPYLRPDYPSALTCGQINTPLGTMLCVTIRSGNTTLTLLMNRDTANNWAAMIGEAADKLTGLIIPNGVKLP